ncbi:sensor histidine kinase [Marispirochaeta aestuarii]|uniref:cache domain-containing sensor histidine kinase n=1 Tax=Marispirochaeta aestuarii TaxID=1963862 RepID=UPI0029C8BB08|nr:sensor histidine kinase [Marispirochaeta aestuarii]
MIRIFNSTIQKLFFKYFFLTSIIAITAFCFFSFTFYVRSFIKNERDHIVSTTNKAKYNIEFILSIVRNSSVLLSANETVTRNCTARFMPGDPEQLESQVSVDTLLRNSVSINEHLNGIYVLGKNGMFFSSYWDVNEDKIRRWLGLTTDHEIEKLFGHGKNNQGIYIPQLERNAITYLRPIYQFPATDRIGLLIIDINYVYLREIFTYSSLTTTDPEKVLVVNSLGETLFTFPFNLNMDFLKQDYPELFTSVQKVIETTIFGKDSFIISEPFQQNDWRIIRVFFKDKIHSTTNLILIMLLLFLVGMTVIYLVISLLLSNSIARPIIDLNEKLKIIQGGNFNVKITSDREDEIGQLNETFNKMTVRIDHLLKQSVAEQKRKSDLEFEVLEAQINPHFLYNTLDSIKWLAVLQGMENISDMISSLINLLKYNISNSSRLVNLEDEITSVRNYISIQQFRYGDIFSVMYSMPTNLLHLKILKFILQPLVENAIFHGLKDMDSNGKIRVEAELLDAKSLLIHVRDNGPGFSFTDRDCIMENTNKSRGMHSGIGMKNVHERITLYFGFEFGLSFSNNIDGGACVSLKLPLICDDNNDPTDAYT